MTLNEYLRSEGAMSVAELRTAIGARNDDQIKQWQHGYAGRLPSRENCARIERATKGAVTCEELRPEDPWHRIADKSWPWNKRGRPLLDVSKAPA